MEHHAHSPAGAHQNGLMLGARSFIGHACDGHTLAAQLDRTDTPCCKTAV